MTEGTRLARFIPALLLTATFVVLFNVLETARLLPVDRLKATAEPWKIEELTSLGTFTAYAYCNCERCCGSFSGGPTASGTMPEVGRTVAADWSVLPPGMEIYISGLGWRTVEDTGNGIAGNKLDVYMSDHQSALVWGVKSVKVYIRRSGP